MSFARVLARAAIVLGLVAPLRLAAQRAGCDAAIRPIDLALDPTYRLSALRSNATGSGDILRDAIVCNPRDSAASTKATDAVRTRFALLDLRVVWNQDVPDMRDNGALWAGRGASALLS